MLLHINRGFEFGVPSATDSTGKFYGKRKRESIVKVCACHRTEKMQDDRKIEK